MRDEIDNVIRVFVADHIESVAQLELLLMLHREPQTHCSAADAARAFGLSPDMTEKLLSDLCRDGLATSVMGEPPTFRYAPRTPAIDNTIARLAALYQERRVSLIQMIYAAPVDRLRSFADAFDLRKKREDD